ncbi:MAG: PQQ-dependent sugar dehydrogenase [Hyphomicrobiales bacterium]
MSISTSVRGGLIAAGSFAFLIAAPGSGAAQPGFSPLDKTKPAESKQDGNLKPHPTPPIAPSADKLPIDKIKLPSGFKAEVWSSGHPGARTMVMGDKGTMFMGTRTIGRVYAITDKGGKREPKVIIQGMTQPNGLAFKDGSLYVFAINKVFRYDKIEDNLDKLPEPVELTKAYDLPDTIHHNWKYVDFGPDGKMYVQVGSNCNICETNPGIHGQIRRYNADGTGMEIVARGVRNTVGFDWHPVTKELWFTDNGRDWAGNAGPEDELNRIPKNMEGASFGFPYCHAMGIPDPDVKRPNPCAGVIMPAALTGPHAAGLGIKFYTGSMFPKSYQNVAFIARHGSWNREQKYGYDVVMAKISGGKATIMPFMTGLLNNEKNEFYGRPSYVFQMKDGSLLVSDETSGAVYRITYGDAKTAAR